MATITVVETLKSVLADSYILYLKTQNFHWNVTGPNFKSLHLLFEEQYNELALAVDTIAERIRALGQYAPGSFKEFSKLASVKEAGAHTSASQMVKSLAADQTAIVATLKKALKAAQKDHDEVTIGLLTERMAVHEKNRWMLTTTLNA